MKKLVFRLLIGLVALLVLAVIAVSLFLDGAVKRGVERIGSSLTKVNIQLQRVSLSPWSGSGKLSGLVVGNPEGFKTPSAISVGTAGMALEPASLFHDKVHVKSIQVEGPEITFETDLRGNNLSKILANVQAATGGGGQKPAPAPESKSGKKLQVDEFIIKGGKVHVSLTALAGKSATVPLPDIQLTNLGQGPEGITPAELAAQVLHVVIQKATEVSAGTVADLSRNAADLTKDLGKTATEKVTKGLGDLFKKKEK